MSAAAAGSAAAQSAEMAVQCIVPGSAVSWRQMLLYVCVTVTGACDGRCVWQVHAVIVWQMHAA